MHELLIAHAQRKSKQHQLPSCLSRLPVSWKQHKLWTRSYYCIGQQLLKFTTKKCAMATFSLCSNVESTTKLLTGMIKNRPRLWLWLRFIGLLSRPLKLCSASHHSFEHISLWLSSFDVYTWHYISEPSELVAECIYCTLKKNRNCYKKDDRLKNFSSTVYLFEY